MLHRWGKSEGQVSLPTGLPRADAPAVVWSRSSQSLSRCSKLSDLLADFASSSRRQKDHSAADQAQREARQIPLVWTMPLDQPHPDQGTGNVDPTIGGIGTLADRRSNCALPRPAGLWCGRPLHQLPEGHDTAMWRRHNNCQ